MSGTKKERPEEIFRRYGGQLRMSEAIAHGITRYMLYALKDRGVIELVSRGYLARLSRFLSTKAIFAGEASLSELQPAKFSLIPGPIALGRATSAVRRTILTKIDLFIKILPAT